MPNNVNFFTWLGKSHYHRQIVARASHTASSCQAAPSCHVLHWHAAQAAPSRRTAPSCGKLLGLWHTELLNGTPQSSSLLSGSSFSSWQLARRPSRDQWNRCIGLITSGRVSSKKAIFPRTSLRKKCVRTSNKSARSWLLSEANVWVSIKGATYDGQGKVRHCKRSFCTDVLVLARNTRTFPPPTQLLERMSTKMWL